MNISEIKVIPAMKRAVCEITSEKNTVILPAFIECEKAKWKEFSKSFMDLAKKIHGIEFGFGKGGIRLIQDKSVGKSGYRLNVEKCADLFLCDIDGLNYGFSTLMQLLCKTNGGIKLPTLKVEDFPETKYRGIMVDLARKWHAVDEILFYIDLCYLCKINYLQLHFTDDQSYTLPSAVLPKLSTEGRHYTFKEIERIVCYARGKNVNIVPEIDMPGHFKSAIDSYPELFANDYEKDEHTQTDNIACIGNPETFKWLDKLIFELCQLFPYSKYIHVGGDEANRQIWGKCVNCSKFMLENNIPDTYGLYSLFISKTTEMVLKNKRTPIVWEGFPRSGAGQIFKKVIVMAWESCYNPAPDLVEEGFEIINCSWMPLYLVDWKNKPDWGFKEILKWNIYNWQHFLPISIATEKPINIAPTEKVIGAQVCTWEADFAFESGHIVEFAAALTERTWTIGGKVQEQRFFDKLQSFKIITDKLLKDLI